MRRFAVSILLAALATAPVLAAKVQTDHNPRVNFSNYKTYAWKAKVPPAEADPEGNFRKLHELVIATADAELDDRGYEKVDEQPDFYLSYSAVAQSDAYLDTHWVSGGWRVGTVEIYAAGNLVVEFVDAATDKVIWRGWAAGGVKPEKMDSRVPRFIKQILKKFPPPAAPR